MSFTHKAGVSSLSPGAYFLKGSQSMQRCLLRMGETSNTRDIEPLVGSVSLECSQILTIIQIPQPNGSVISTTGKRAAVGTDFESLHHSLMSLSHPQALPTFNLPPAQLAIAVSTDQQLPAWTPYYG
jgi:hypothetical protein